MSSKDPNKKVLIKNYEVILSNCRKSLEKHHQLTSSDCARNIPVLNSQRQEFCGRKDSFNYDEEQIGRTAFELRNECVQKIACSKWIDTLPPLWDECLEKDYVEYVVSDVVAHRFQDDYLSNETSRPAPPCDVIAEPKTEKKDQAVLVTSPDLVQSPLPTWKPVEDAFSTILPKDNPVNHASYTCLTKKSLPPDAEPSQPAVAKNVFSATFSKTAKNVARDSSTLKTSTSRILPNTSGKSKKSQTPPKPEKPRKHTPNRCMYLRFVGKPRKQPIDFSAEHPELALEDTAAEHTSFPCRIDRIDLEGKSGGEEKLNVSLETPRRAEDKQEPSQSTSEQKQDKTQSSVTVQTDNVDKTWKEILTASNNGARAGKILKYNRLEVPPPSGTTEEAVGRDVIYDSENIIRPSEKLTMSKLTVQKLPVLCIRGECKIQKIVEISIDGTCAACPQNERNVGFVEMNHNTNPKDSPKSVKVIKNDENIEIKAFGEKDEKRTGVGDGKAPRQRDIDFVEPLPKHEVATKSNRFLAPFTRPDLSEYEIASQNIPEPFRSTEVSNAPSTTENSQSSMAINDTNASGQTDDEKLSVGSSLKLSSSSSSSSSYTNPMISEASQSNPPKESNTTTSFTMAPSSSGEVSQFFIDKNRKLKCNDTVEVQNILKEVFSNDSENEDVSGECPKGQKGNAAVGIDCSDLKKGIEISVQTDDIMGNFSGDFRKELANSPDKEDVVDQIIEKICRDPADALQKFKLRMAPKSGAAIVHEMGSDRPARPIDLNVTDAHDLEIDDRLSKTALGESIKGNSSGATSKPPINGTIGLCTLGGSSGTKGPPERTPGYGNLSEFRTDNNTDNLGAIKGDEVEEQSHNADEASSSSCLGSHANLLGRNCYCHRHRSNDVWKDKDFTRETVLSPLDDLYDGNLRLNSPFKQSNYRNSSPQAGGRDDYKTFHRKVLESSPKFSKTLAKIYDAAPNITARSSNRMDPEVQRAVKKFLDSLLEPQTSNRRERYTKFSNVSPTLRTGHSLNCLESKTSTSTQATNSTFTSSPRREFYQEPRTFSSVWKTNESATTISETESSDLQRMLYAPLWDDLPTKTTGDDLRSLTGSFSSLIESDPSKQSRSGAQPQHHARNVSDGEVLSLGEVRSLDS